MATSRADPIQRRVVVDEAWLREWVNYGLLELTVYLEKQAAFTQYLKSKEKP